MLLTDWTADAEALLPETVALRRAIHTEPEVGLHLPKTTARIKAELAGLPLEFREGPSTTGLIVRSLVITPERATQQPATEQAGAEQ